MHFTLHNHIDLDDQVLPTHYFDQQELEPLEPGQLIGACYAPPDAGSSFPDALALFESCTMYF